MLVAVAVCPHPPLLVPDVAAGAVAELEPVRLAAAEALETVRGAAPQILAVVGVEDTARRRGPAPPSVPGAGVASGWRDWPEGAAGTFCGFGVPLDVVLGEAGASDRPRPAGREALSPADDQLPLSLAVASWLLDAAGWTVPVLGRSLADGLSAAECGAAGKLLADAAERVGLLVMADGSARRSERAPGHVDPRAAAFDAAVVRALESGDPARLAAIDGSLAAELLASGWPAWQALAGAADGGRWHGRVHYADAPYGVAYTVASWAAA